MIERGEEDGSRKGDGEKWKLTQAEHSWCSVTSYKPEVFLKEDGFKEVLAQFPLVEQVQPRQRFFALKYAADAACTIIMAKPAGGPKEKATCRNG
ncbi:hypothetical protein SLEP1_g30417 [Rubroshorea leprosula]|uniref:Uncharacterized protein n=1 Tax=Rubroshorea leprosula TaxID=152421 RepID=A0AAV5K5V7_9ROSI|nr:hypothetical protein SLEP1_g30417 [Rubroshorea leprosula]